MNSLAAVLLVDDEPDNLDALKRLLRKDFDVVAVTTPVDALRELQRRRFHVVVSDQRMPEMTGVELLEKAKVLQPNATRILLTGYTDIESVIGAINRGQIWRYIAKPWDPEELKITLRQADEAFRLRSELEEKNRDLAAALTELQALDRAKARFLAIVSHELNTPLTVLGGFVDLLLDGKEGLEPDQRSALDSLNGAKARLAEIVADTLSFTRLELDPVDKESTTSIADAAKAALAATAKAFQGRGVTVTPTFDSTAPAVAGGKALEDALRRVFEEIARRAAPKSEVLLRTDAKATLVALWQGEAMDAEAFEPFATGGELLHHSRNLGLGLAIARRIFDKLGVGAVAKKVPRGGTLELRFRSSEK